jgi:hypothetical protein
MIPDLANDPAVQAALHLNQIRRGQVSLKDKLLFLLPIPAGCYLLAKGVPLAANSGGDPLAALANGLVGSVESMGGFICFFLAVRAYFKIRQARQAD